MPYPLPDGGPPYSTDLRWFLVAVPDEAAFVQAALGAYTEFTHYWKWGKEGKEPGRNEAAQAWEDAVGATLEALEMGFPDALLGYIDGVETLLQTLIDSQCCATGSPVSDLYTDDWEDGDPVPQNIVDAGFASSTSDQTGYTDYKCLIANVAVQDLIEKVTRLANILDDEAGTIIGGIGAVVALLGFILAIPATAALLTAMTIGILLGVGAATTIASFAVASGKEGMNDLAEALELAYDDLVCAIYSADGNEAAKEAVSDAITTATSALDAAVLSLIINSVIDALYAGRYDQTNTAQVLADAGFTLAQHDCNCAPDTSPSGLRLVVGTYGINLDAPTCPDTMLLNTTYTATQENEGHGGLVQLWAKDCSNVTVFPRWRIRVLSSDYHLTGYNSAWWGGNAIAWLTTSGGSVISAVSQAALVLDQWYEAPEGASFVTVYAGNTPPTYTVELQVLEAPA